MSLDPAQPELMLFVANSKRSGVVVEHAFVAV
jgi:hypothetical protein